MSCKDTSANVTLLEMKNFDISFIFDQCFGSGNFRAASAASASAPPLPLPLPPKPSYFTSSYPTHEFGSG